ncbi:hypothetical protein, partial [Weizmannia sp. CD-2023]|uniref:hypothetical protein n=1 Tax=Weizmannia sp. CD-2023 TaxID=3037263 RepID=UPI002E231EA7|nr:hypothetical protein [Weizmannia sp. CD-2023]
MHRAPDMEKRERHFQFFCNPEQAGETGPVFSIFAKRSRQGKWEWHFPFLQVGTAGKKGVSIFNFCKAEQAEKNGTGIFDF